MKTIILDTNFILTAVRQKIDFFHDIKLMGMQILIPSQVLRELKGLGAKLPLKIVEKNNFEIINVGGKDADTAIIKFAKKNPLVIVATLDAGLKKKIKNPKMVIRQRKKLEII